MIKMIEWIIFCDKHMPWQLKISHVPNGLFVMIAILLSILLYSRPNRHSLLYQYANQNEEPLRSAFENI